MGQPQIGSGNLTDRRLLAGEGQGKNARRARGLSKEAVTVLSLGPTWSHAWSLLGQHGDLRSSRFHVF